MLGKNRHHYGTDGRVRQVNHHQPPYARVQFPDVPIKRNRTVLFRMVPDRGTGGGSGASFEKYAQKHQKRVKN